MGELTRDAILAAIRDATQPLAFVDAMCEGGSAAWGRANPLALVLRMRHCPERFDFWLKYSDVDLPAPIAAMLRRLAYPADLAALARMRAEAEVLFHATVAELETRAAQGSSQEART